VRTCRECGCTDADCRGCIDRTGEPCHWIEADLCSACKHGPVIGAANLHHCAVPGCTRNISIDKLMCHLHWSMVPAAIARDIWRTWRKRGLAREYAEARAAAIAAVAKGVAAWKLRHP